VTISITPKKNTQKAKLSRWDCSRACCEETNPLERRRKRKKNRRNVIIEETKDQTTRRKARETRKTREEGGATNATYPRNLKGKEEEMKIVLSARNRTIG
jgi:hypothetical protein